MSRERRKSTSKEKAVSSDLKARRAEAETEMSERRVRQGEKLLTV